MILYIYEHITRRKHLITIELVIRDVKPNKLYFIYSKFNLSYYNSVSSGMGKSIISKSLFRKDSSIVEVGNKAYFYIRKTLNVLVDSQKNIVILNNKNIKSTIRYNNVNKNYSINNFYVLFFRRLYRS